MAGKYTFKRDLYTDVIHSMSNSRATFLLGARKCGKTVCLKQIKDEYENAEYIDFKEKTDKEKSEVFLQIQKSIENDENKIYLLDEITYATNPEINICILAGLFSEYDTKNVRIVFAGSQSLALERWGHIAFGGSAGYVRPDFLSYAEWLRYKQISEPSAESYEQFLYGAMEFYGFTSMQDYLQGCIDETIISNTKTSNYIYGNDCNLLDADVLLDICYATLFTLHNHVTSSIFMKNNGLKDNIGAYFAKVCAELGLDARISDSFISRYNSFERKDLKVLEQAFLFLHNRDLITVTPVVNNLDNIPDLEQEFQLIAHGKKPCISFKDDLFRDFNVCIKYPVFYVAILRDIFKEQMPAHLPHGLLGSIMECQTRGLLSGKGAVEYRDLSGNEVDYVNVIDHTAVEITIANKSLKETHFDCLPDDYKCCLLTKDKTDVVQNIQLIPYYDFINNGANWRKTDGK